MPASAETRLSNEVEKVDSQQATNGTATATFAAVSQTVNYVFMAMVSANGTIAAGVRCTLTYTRNGVVTTIGFQLPNAAIAPIVLNFGSHPIEGDANTAITLTLPALGASITGEATLIGYTRPE